MCEQGCTFAGDSPELSSYRSYRYRYRVGHEPIRRFSAPAAVPNNWCRQVFSRWLCRNLRVLGRSISFQSGGPCCQTLRGGIGGTATLHYPAILAQAFRRFFHRDGSGSRYKSPKLTAYEKPENKDAPRLDENVALDPSRPALTASQVRELKAAFSMLDKNKDGRVNEMEIKCMLEKLGIVLTDTMVGKLIDQASKRGDRLLSEEEFLAWMAHQSVQEDVMADLMAAFRVFDKDRNGYITRVHFQFGSIFFEDVEVTDFHQRHSRLVFQVQVIDDIVDDLIKDELRTAMEMIGEPMSEEQLDLMIRATDIDNDGRINYEEFVRMLL